MVRAAWVMGWIAVVLTLDTHGSLTTQRLLGVATWLLLLAALRRDAALTASAETSRTHTAVDDNVIAGAPPTG